MIRLIELVFGVILKNQDSQIYIEKIMELEEDAQTDLQKIIKQSLNLIDGIEIEDDSMSSDNTPQRLNTEEHKFSSENVLEFEGNRRSMQRLKTVEDNQLFDNLNFIDVPKYNEGFDSAQSKGSRKKSPGNILSPDKFNRLEAEFAIQRETAKVEELMS